MNFFPVHSLVSLDKIVEVRCGQQTKNFIKFPYTEVESQSFSLIFEKEQGMLPWKQIKTKTSFVDKGQ